MGSEWFLNYGALTCVWKTYDAALSPSYRFQDGKTKTILSNNLPTCPYQVINNASTKEISLSHFSLKQLYKQARKQWLIILVIIYKFTIYYSCICCSTQRTTVSAI